MKPPYEITQKILNFVVSISQMLGEIKATHLTKQSPELRKKNRIKTIQASLEIEGNTLSLDQVTAIFENKRVIGPATEILEVKNAVQAYEEIESFKANSKVSFLKAHGILMNDLVEEAGKFRTQSVGIVAGNKVKHVAPPGKIVPELMDNLFDYLKNDSDPSIIKSCVFHYEMEFIHPFMDGNGRLGRLWQSKILSEEFPIFLYLPLESLIKEKQAMYYDVLGRCDKCGKSTEFIEFMLEIISEQLSSITEKPRNESLNQNDRLKIAETEFLDQCFSRSKYLALFKEISSASASRDLAFGVESGILRKIGEKRLSEYQFVKN